ncbi:SH3 domain-containing protein [Bacillus shivajii]|uniref:SH3 domain-containing protein n=1 Tax=Bacillus shivajii TaxID=1983719 RepID=UPI001CFBE1FF|nr:SH3 domain-containing protein [Bacillus shivajii]UCZ52903.1 SH3 domain-containing protein [Bacillus shivajii]
MEIISNIWISFPEWSRPLVVGFLVILLTRSLFLWGISQIFKLQLVIGYKLVEMIFFLIAIPFGWYIKAKRKSRYLFIEKAEDGMRKCLSGIDFLKDKAVILKTKKKFYYIGIMTLSCIMALSLFNNWKAFAINEIWESVDAWFVEDVLEASELSSEEAATTVKGWFGIEESIKAQKDSEDEHEMEEVQYQLSKSQTGGNLREYPVESTSTDNVVGTVYPHTELTFLGEAETVNRIEWLKVQTDEGVVGWISSRIVEKVE